MWKSFKWALAGCLAVAMTAQAADSDLFKRAPWFVTVGGNWYQTEGDTEAKPGPGIMLKLGYSLNAWWDIEAGLNYMPVLGNRDQSDLNDSTPALEDDTTAIRTGIDVLLHLRSVKNRRFDPFLSAGPYVTFWGDDMHNGKTQFGVNGGIGMFYHFDDSWALRGDVVVGVGGSESEFFSMAELGVTYRIGAKRQAPAVYEVSGGMIDSDGDGLSDWDEVNIYGTDPYNPDTDGDGLSDGDEVLKYGTDPLNPDTDFDGLSDGAEVLVYGTDPLNPDTDGGGVSDGHEVLEDGTNPLDPSDDVQLFRLNIEFDYDKADIRPQYYKDLEPVVKVLQRDPNAIVRVEGHADKRPTSRRAYNQRLSERRAKAVATYLITHTGINPDRVTSVGFGYDRPIAPNDTEANMQKNRRTDIYIRKGGVSP